MKRKWVYFLSDNLNIKNSDKLKEILGGKGAGLYFLAKMGLPVPPAFIISTSACRYYLKNKKLPKGLLKEVYLGIEYLEKRTKKRFGNKDNPLLVSVRSGAKFSMPGMMDTILNLGINDEVVEGLIKKTNNPDFAYDIYKRFIEIFSEIIFGIKREEFLKISDNKEKTIEKYKEIFYEKTKREFPQNPYECLKMAIEGVFNSWNNPRAKEYRKIYQIPEDLGTAVNIQAMVFGNWDEKSGTGVLFTRNVKNGENKIYGEFLFKAQGEDLVAGHVTPLPLETLKEKMPKVYIKLERYVKKLEKKLRDVQDVEFTIENGKLYFLQTRAAKRTPLAAIKIACDMVKERLITKEEAIMRISSEDIDYFLHPTFDPNHPLEIIAKGKPASPGCAVGEIVLTAEKAIEVANQNRKVILVRNFTKADDVAGMAKSEGFVTTTGGETSHAAVVARGMGKPCIVGCADIIIDFEKKILKIKNLILKEGDKISINGTTGEIIKGEVPLIKSEFPQELNLLLSWADEIAKIKVRANADTPIDAENAKKMGAKGIGLARTEHMFFAPERIKYVQLMILAKDEKERKEILSKLLPFQKNDFKELFKVMNGLPVTIRTLDPPLHEFLPPKEKVEAINQLASELNVNKEILIRKIEELEEHNPMMGLRGCRLGIIYPEITEMQVRAILEAACEAKKEGIEVNLEIMIPLVSLVEEFLSQKKIIEKVSKEVFEKEGVKLNYKIGTMIETPRACLIAKELAKYVDFFSYGTNDLTQFVFGFSRDDSEKFLIPYQQKRIINFEPFKTIDEEGVGSLIITSVLNAKKINKNIKIGICGEHGGDEKSIFFAKKINIDYVSCSPYRVPKARLAAAQAEIYLRNKKISLITTK
ncbi:MAG: pyruvate, phosphate dikinase [candidate division WOR-3 bacterium]|nr:pyruvate, phosphate dikinase [candidate division WOR-3 bacterium]MCX7837209.1 pyruvate, phosphate dikinase [candidate division WOR-3 bacterium]MDW8114601.1 pyruvate, phosphate dikinase [candidate division WOR-3 bacterium]